MIPDADLAAYADGELPDGDRRRRLEAALAADPALAARLARHRALRDALPDAYAAPLATPTPQALMARLEASAPAAGGFGRWAAPAGLLAAGLAAGVLLGWALGGAQASLVTDAQGLRAAGPLARALDRQLSGQPGAIEVSFSVRTADGRACRAFSAEGAWAGLACRSADAWRVVATAPLSRAGAEADFRPAGATLPLAVLEAADGLRAGDPFDRQQEAQARGHRWQPAGR